MAKVGRNDPCPCGSGKKYKQCHMLKDQEAATAAKYTPSGKRKFKAKVLSLGDKSLSVFNRAANGEAPTGEGLERLKFRQTAKDFRVKEEEPETVQRAPEAEEQPEETERNLPKEGEIFHKTEKDFRKKE